MLLSIILGISNTSLQYTVLLKEKHHISCFCKKMASGSFSISCRNSTKMKEQQEFRSFLPRNCCVFLREKDYTCSSLNMNRLV